MVIVHTIMEPLIELLVNCTKDMLENHDAQYDILNLNLIRSIFQNNHKFKDLLRTSDVKRSHE